MDCFEILTQKPIVCQKVLLVSCLFQLKTLHYKSFLSYFILLTGVNLPRFDLFFNKPFKSPVTYTNTRPTSFTSCEMPIIPV